MALPALKQKLNLMQTHNGKTRNGETHNGETHNGETHNGKMAFDSPLEKILF